MNTKEILSLIFDLTEFSAWDWDIKNNILTVNDRWFEIMGYVPNEFVPTPEFYYSCVHPEDLKNLQSVKLVHTEGNSGTFSNKHRLKKKDGSYAWILSTGKVVARDESGQPIRMIGGIKDISEEIEAKLALEESEKKLKQAQSIAQIGSWYFDVATTKISWSEQMYSFFDLDPKNGEPSFKDHLTGIHPDDREVWTTAVSKGLKGESYQIIFRTNTPAKLYMEAFGVPTFDENGNVISLSGTCQNITERINTEIERAKMSQSSKLATLGEMASGIAHEINNPLTIIRGYLKMIEFMGTEKEIPRDEIKDSVKKAQGAIDRTAKIVSSLKYFSRDASQDPFEVVSVQNIVEDTLSFCHRRLEKNGVLLDVKIPEQPLYINGRPVEISQIILNLVLNAFDAVRSMSPERKWVKLIIEANKNIIEIRVLDNGNGILKEIRPKLFEPFNTSKPAGQGTGLGLSISKSIAKVHSGDLVLESAQTPTTFLLTVPQVHK